MASLMDADLALALDLQWRLDEEAAAAQEEANREVAGLLPPEMRTPGKVPTSSPSGDAFSSSSRLTTTSLVAPEWEDLDPTPDLHALFREFDRRFFWSSLQMCEVRWSPRMTLCAGVCSYQRRAGYCSIRLSVPLLKLRPRSDLVETLLHEMIHAYLFVTDGDDDHDGHGPAFHRHMGRINGEAGTNISVYHSFYDEVAEYQTHWWRCDGPCQARPPYFGLVKRSMNRAPGKNDRWFAEHQANCGGTFVKIKEPEGYGKRKSSKRKLVMEEQSKGQRDIRSFGTGSKGKENRDGASNSRDDKRGVAKPEASKTGKPTSASGGGGGGGGGGAGVRGNIFGFGGPSFAGSSETAQTKGKSGTMVVNPGWRQPVDNSSGGEAIGPASSSATTPVGSSQGCRLGGVGPSSSASGDARQSVRDFWSSRFSSSSTGGCAPEPPQGLTGTASPTVECPVCSRPVSEDKINQHLDDCLARGAINGGPDEEKAAVGVGTDAGNDVDDTNRCPKCRRDVYKGEMDFHRRVCR